MIKCFFEENEKAEMIDKCEFAKNICSAKIYCEKMFNLTGKKPVSVVDISPVIGMTAGIGSVAVSLLFD